jgi:hypothetical protein
MSRVRVTIHRLVLHGIDPGNHLALVDGLQSELSHLLADREVRPLLTVSHRMPVLRLQPIPLQIGRSGTRMFGKEVARSIAKGLKS